ncbi:DUF4230 domain-containing protein [Sphingomonas sp.]|uniref:DUF4230 domain-containing protein n=1 Tax=Sphingomonas sp. TaxID=28214 RepID=UPI002BDC29AC|nr:DUF4230 domain-containing protein [Sphingomonas sp.]HWK34904.1 DUF4230 domain-containing protein [Sphingomonas sp.]
MAPRLNPEHLRMMAVAVVAAIVVATGVWFYDRYREERVATVPGEGGQPITQIVSARLAGASALKVADLSGTVQSTASDIRAMGWLRSDQIVKMPYSVSYFVDLSRLGARDLQWNADTRTLIVDAPDVVPAAPNTDEGRRTLVQTNGLFVTRGAAEELSRLTSLHAGTAASREAQSPERMAQAREHARRAVADLLARPLAAAGLGDVRVVVTFPPERRDHERWDTTRSVAEVLDNGS